jgi:hypothetical protein
MHAVHCVAPVVEQSEEFSVLVEPLRFKSSLVKVQETEYRLDQVAECARLLWGKVDWHGDTVRICGIGVQCFGARVLILLLSPRRPETIV